MGTGALPPAQCLRGHVCHPRPARSHRRQRCAPLSPDDFVDERSSVAVRLDASADSDERPQWLADGIPSDCSLLPLPSSPRRLRTPLRPMPASSRNSQPEARRTLQPEPQRNRGPHMSVDSRSQPMAPRTDRAHPKSGRHLRPRSPVRQAPRASGSFPVVVCAVEMSTTSAMPIRVPRTCCDRGCNNPDGPSPTGLAASKREPPSVQRGRDNQPKFNSPA